MTLELIRNRTDKTSVKGFPENWLLNLKRFSKIFPHVMQIQHFFSRCKHIYSRCDLFI